MELRCENISRLFLRGSGESNVFYAVKPSDFILCEGKVTEIIGRSGSGKTTFINMLSGLLTPSEGKVIVDGKDLYSMSDEDRSLFRNKHIGMIPQGQTALGSLTVLENILLPVRMYGDNEDRLRSCSNKAIELMERLGIKELEEVFPKELSGGENRRMAIIRALINDPEIIIADEPTGNLDDKTTADVLDLLKERSVKGSSVLIVTHEKEAFNYADIIYRMDAGDIRSYNV